MNKLWARWPTCFADEQWDELWYGQVIYIRLFKKHASTTFFGETQNCVNADKPSLFIRPI